MGSATYRSVFSPATRQERKENFENYGQFTQQHGGELFEEDRDLAKKRARLKHFQDNPVKLRKAAPCRSGCFFQPRALGRGVLPCATVS